MRAWTYGTCRELSDIEDSIASRRKKYVDLTYMFLDNILGDNDSLHFYYHYYPQCMTNSTDEIPTLTILDIFECIKTGRRGILKIVLPLYLGSMDTMALCASASILPYATINDEMARRSIMYEHIVDNVRIGLSMFSAAVAGRNDSMILELLKLDATYMSRLLTWDVTINQGSIFYVLHYYRSWISISDHIRIIRHIGSVELIPKVMHLLPLLTTREVLHEWVRLDRDIVPLMRELKVSDQDEVTGVIFLYLDMGNTEMIRRIHRAGYHVPTEILLDHIAYLQI